MATRYKRILFPTDFSDLSRVALHHALELAEVFDAEFYCLHVVDEAFQYWSAMGPESIPVGPPPEELLESGHHRMKSFKAEHLSTLKKEPHIDVVIGRPFSEIIGYAQDNEVDVIVMGTHGRGAFAHMLLGSTTEKVLRKACCPVLTVRAPDHDLETP
jgi:nucleotide-binding universal stress UspA family protein